MCVCVCGGGGGMGGVGGRNGILSFIILLGSYSKCSLLAG